MDLNAFKCIQIHIPQKWTKNAKNGKKCKKCQKITNNCKISEITKYGKKMTQMGLKRPKNGKISDILFHRFSGSKLPQTSVGIRSPKY